MKKLLRSSNFINTFWNLLDVMIFPVVFLGLTPFFMREMGTEEFGLWMLINSVLASFQLMNFGLGSATQRNVARFRGRNEGQLVVQSINTNLSLAILLMGICLLVGFGLFTGVKYLNLFHLENLVKGKAADLMLMASFLVSLKFIEQIFQHALKGFENFKVAARLNLAVRFSILLANILLVLSGYGLYAMIGSHIIISLIFLFIHLLAAKKIIPQYHFYIRFEKANILDELRYGIHTWLQSVAVIITYQMDRFIITSFFGLAALSYYTIVATMFNHIHMAFNALVPWLLPKVARLREKGAEVAGLFLSARSFVLIVGIGALLLFYSLSNPIFKLWLGESIYLELAGYVRLFVVFELFFLFTSAPYFFMNANGNERLMTRITWINAIITLSCMLLGIYLFHQVEGLIYGLITGTIIGTILENTLINQHVLHQNPMKESFLIILPSSCAALIVLSSSPIVISLSFITLLISAYLLFVRSGEFNLKTLLFG